MKRKICRFFSLILCCCIFLSIFAGIEAITGTAALSSEYVLIDPSAEKSVSDLRQCTTAGNTADLSVLEIGSELTSDGYEGTALSAYTVNTHAGVNKSGFVFNLNQPINAEDMYASLNSSTKLSSDYFLDMWIYSSKDIPRSNVNGTNPFVVRLLCRTTSTSGSNIEYHLFAMSNETDCDLAKIHSGWNHISVPLRAGGQTAPKTIVAMTVEQHTGISESFTFAVAEAKIVAKDIEIDDKAVISYTFTGDNADNAGFAEGTIAVTPSSASALNGNYEVYFADDNGILDGYESVFTSAVTGSTVTFKMGEGTMIPAAATKIVLFNSLITDKSLKNAISYYEIPAYKRITTGDVRRTFASVSDVHVNYDDNGYGASEKWTAALNFFNKNGMDYVIVSGDMTGTGTETEYQRYVNASLSSDYPFENIYEARGNHDSTQNENFLKYTSGSGEVRPYENSPYYYVLLDGNGGAKDDLFIFMAQELSATGGTSTTDNFSDAQLDWVENLLKNYSGTNTNIFLVEHSMIRNFGPGDKYDGAYSEPMYFADQFSGNMRFKSLLTEYKEVIMMSGHTHLSLYEHYNYSDENGNAARMIHNGSTSQPRSYTASGTISYNSEGKTTETYGSEGYLVYVYDDYVCYIGCNLSEGKIIPSASYIIPLYSENRSDVASIDVTQMPDKTEYEEGEYFDPTGMVITATMSDGSRQIVKGWGISSVYKLTADDKSVTVNFGGCTAAVAISVKGEQTFEGLGTSDNPYLISSADDFNRLTDLFNESTSSSSKYGEGLYFRQTADIDMTGYSGYNGTAADGNNKKYFAGNYNGDGYAVTVAINSTDQRSVFPYFYGTLCNLIIRGSITGVTSAQPIRTNYGTVVNCVFELNLSAQYANGLCYSSYGTVYNTYIEGTSSGTYINAVARTTSGASYTNVYTYRLNASGSVVTDSRAVSSNNLSAVSSAFNGSKDSAQTKINGAVICSADVKDGHIIWNHPMSGPVHSLVKVEEKKATCLSDGNTAYFHCGECGKNFADENGEKEISDSETTIAKLDANYAEETDSLIVYDGNWETINNLRNASGKALIRGFKSGSTVTFSFVGKSFGIIGYTSPTYGMISVQVDDNAAETIDLYSEEAAYQTPIYDRYVGDGVHKVTVTILNTKNASAGRTGLYYAAIDQIVTDGSLIPVDKKIDDIALTVTENTVSVVLPAPFVAGTPVENLQASAMNGTVEVISENTVVYTVSPLHVNDVITYTVNGFTGNVIVMYDTGILHQFENLEHTAPWRLFNSWYLDEHSAVYTATAGAEYSFTVTAAAIELIGYRSKTYSSFDVYVDGEYVKSVDEYAQSGYFYRENLGTVNLGENKTHTITIKANGRVILDAYRLSK